jgi:hypothetical protein
MPTAKKKPAKGYQRGGFVPPPAPKKTSKAAPAAKKRKGKPKPKMPTLGGNIMGLGGTGAGGMIP